MRGGVSEKSVSVLSRHSGSLTLAFIAICIAFGIIKPANYWTLMRGVFCPLSVSLCFFLVKVRDRLNKRIVWIIAALGMITLEIYLTHEKILSVVGKLFGKINILGTTVQSIIINIAAVVIAIGVSYAISKIYEKVFLHRQL